MGVWGVGAMNMARSSFGMMVARRVWEWGVMLPGEKLFGKKDRLEFGKWIDEEVHKRAESFEKSQDERLMGSRK